jgi:polyferredoxin
VEHAWTRNGVRAWFCPPEPSCQRPSSRVNASRCCCSRAPLSAGGRRTQAHEPPESPATPRSLHRRPTWAVEASDNGFQPTSGGPTDAEPHPDAARGRARMTPTNLRIVDVTASTSRRFGAIRRPRRGFAALRGIQGARRTVQVLVLSGVAFLVAGRWSAAASGPAVTSPEAVCPFGGLETLATFLATGAFVPHVHAANLVLASAVLVLALAARGAFCGWICPLGFVQDLVAGASAVVQRRIPAAHRAMRELRGRARPLAILDRPLRLAKYLVLAWSLWGAATFGVMVFRDVDPWIALLDIGRESAGFGLLVLAALLLGALFIDRPWCRYACPLGAANGLAARLSPLRLERNRSACVDCGLCTRSCPMGIDVAKAGAVTSADCTGCLECVEACPRAGALELRVGLPIGGRS